MSEFFSSDNVVFAFLRRVCDVFMLHLLWVICSIPIVTIGASTTALYYTSMKAIQTDDGDISKRFFKSFKENFKQSTILWLIAIVAGFIFSFDMYYAVSHKDYSWAKPMMFVFTIFLCVYLFVMLYIFPLQSKFANDIKTTIRNAFLLSIKNFPWTLLLVIITAVIAFGIYTSPIFGFYMILMGSSSYALLTSTIYLHIFKPYLPKGRDINDEEYRSVDAIDEEDEDNGNKGMEALKAKATEAKPEKSEASQKQSNKIFEEKNAPAKPKSKGLANKANAVKLKEEADEADETTEDTEADQSTETE